MSYKKIPVFYPLAKEPDAILMLIFQEGDMVSARTFLPWGLPCATDKYVYKQSFETESQKHEHKSW